MTFRSNHSCIKVSDLDRSIAFYERALGYRVISVSQLAETVRTCFLDDGTENSLRLQLLQIQGYHPGAQSYGHYAVSTQDIYAAHAHHTAMGCALGPVRDQGHQLSYFILDPDGYETEIVQSC